MQADILEKQIQIYSKVNSDQIQFHLHQINRLFSLIVDLMLHVCRLKASVKSFLPHLNT